MVDGENIRFLDASRVDALMALDMGKCGQPVAIDGGPLEIEVFGASFICRAIAVLTLWLLPDRKSLASLTSSAYP